MQRSRISVFLAYVLMAPVGAAMEGCAEGPRPDAAMQSPAPPFMETEANERCAASGFCWEQPSPQGHTLRAIVSRSATDTLFLGAGGTALHHDGLRFRMLATDSHDDFMAAALCPGPTGAADPSGETFVVGRGGAVLRRSGETLRLLRRGGPDLFAVYCVRAGELYAAGQGGSVLRFDGSGWQELPGVGVDVYALWASRAEDPGAKAPSNLYAAGQSGTLLRLDGGRWENLAVPTEQDLTALSSSGEQLWISGRGGALLTYDLVHAAFRSLSNPLLGDLSTVLADPRGAWFSGGGTLHRVDVDADAVIFTQVYTGGRDLFALGGREGKLWAGGHLGALLHFDGTGWTRQDSALTEEGLLGVAANGAGALTVLGPRGMVLRWQGSGWRRESLPTGVSLTSLWTPPHETEASWAVGNGVFRAVGGQWIALEQAAIPGYAGGALHALWGPGEGDLWAVGNRATVLHHDHGQWRRISMAGLLDNETLSAVWGSDPADVWIAGERGVLLHYNGIQWSRSPLPAEAVSESGERPFLEALWGSHSADVWAVGSQGVVLHYDGGRWERIDDGWPSGSATQWRSVAGRDAQDIWIAGAGARGGALSHFDGQRFTAVAGASPTGLNAIYAAPGQPLRLFGDGGVILREQGAIRSR